jgi:hypothetical protein
MKTLFKTFLLTLFLVSFLHAGENFSEMSTQELIAIMGYVKPNEKAKFDKELQSRLPSMSADEKAKYKKNLRK